MLGQEEKKEILDAIQQVVSLEVNKISSRMDVFEVGQQETHEMIQEFSTDVDRRFEQVDKRFDQMDQRFDRLEGRASRMEAGMVTKDYLDNKLAEHGSRYGEIDRKTNLKIGLLTDSLVAEKSLSVKSAKSIVSAEPFARMK